jgi:hypothetical protein
MLVWPDSRSLHLAKLSASKDGFVLLNGDLALELAWLRLRLVDLRMLEGRNALDARS